MPMAIRIALPVVVAGALSLSTVHAGDHLNALIDAHVSYVNGGFGHEEAEALRAEARAYPLQLTFSRRGEGQHAEFVADVHLQIVDASGRVVIDRESQGPIFMAHLPDGQYTISAEYQGRTQTRRVAVNNERHEAVSFYWG